MVNHKIATGVVKWYMNTMGYSGWTSYWNTVYYKDEDAISNDGLRRHELKHIEQMEAEGKFIFTLRYLWYTVKYGYKNNPYEIEAREAEKGE